MFNVGKIPIFNKGKQTLVTTKYKIIWKKQLTYLESSHDAEHNGIQLFPFEGDLAEKQPYKHRGKIYYIKLKSRLSVRLSSFFFVMPTTRSSRLGSTQDLVCVMAVSSGTSKFVFISP